MEVGRIWGRGIEWDAVRALLASEARTEMGRERALTASPSPSASAIRISARAHGGGPPAPLRNGPAAPGRTSPTCAPSLERCRRRGSVLDGADLLLLIPVLDCAPAPGRVRSRVKAVAPAIAALERGAAAPGRAPRRAAAVRSTTTARSPTRRAPRLAQLRRELRERRRRIVADLERLLQSTEGDRVFAERFVTLRHGRYVVPVRAEARSRVRGIVHDRSQSGQTLFVEPESAVEANNDLVQAPARGGARRSPASSPSSPTRVRARMRRHRPRSSTTVGDLDWIFARAHLAERMDATRARGRRRDGAVDAARPRAIPCSLAQALARSDARPVVPVDVELSPRPSAAR